MVQTTLHLIEDNFLRAEVRTAIPEDGEVPFPNSSEATNKADYEYDEHGGGKAKADDVEDGKPKAKAKATDVDKEEKEEQWDLEEIFSLSEIRNAEYKCDEDCGKVACSVWTKRGDEDEEPWYACADCQSKIFGGFPSVTSGDLPITSIYQSHRVLIAEMCTNGCTADMILPDLPTILDNGMVEYKDSAGQVHTSPPIHLRRHENLLRQKKLFQEIGLGGTTLLAEPVNEKIEEKTEEEREEERQQRKQKKEERKKTLEEEGKKRRLTLRGSTTTEEKSYADVDSPEPIMKKTKGGKATGTFTTKSATSKSTATKTEKIDLTVLPKKDPIYSKDFHSIFDLPHGGPKGNGTSEYAGVSYDKSKGKFRAAIKINGTKRVLGNFVKEKDAAIAYATAAHAHHPKKK